MSNNRTYVVGFIVVIVVVAGVALLEPVLYPTKQTLTVNFKEGTVVLSTEGESLSYEQMLDEIFKSADATTLTEAWLKEKRSTYRLDDPVIDEAIAELCPDQPGEDLIERQARLLECEKHHLVASLRQLASDHAPPFQYVGRKVRISTPGRERDRPKQGKANVCRKRGGLLNKRLELFNPESQVSIEVDATGSYLCVVADRPDVQLSVEDALELFGRPTGRIETAYAVIL